MPKDIESIEFTDDESNQTIFELVNESDEQRLDEIGLFKRILEYFSSFKLFLFITGMSSLLVTFLLSKNVKVVTEMYLHNLNATFFIFGCSLVAFVICGLTIEKISLHMLKKQKGEGSSLYYISELSYYLSLYLVLALQYYLIFQSTFTICLFSEPISANILFSMKLAVVSITLMTLVKILIQYVSARFNYNMFIDSIRRCIIADLFINLLQEIQPDDSSILYHSVNTIKHTISSLNSNFFILDKSFLIDDATQLKFNEKRLLIKLFIDTQKVLKMSDRYLPAVLSKIKSRAKKKGEELSKKFTGEDAGEYVGNLRKYFKEKSVFKFILKQLKLEQENRLDKKLISEVIEKAYKNRYTIYKSISQINAALNRVYYSTQAIIIITTIIFALVFSFTEITLVSGTVSALFGTQFITKILSDYVIQSIIFLFAIHPFDIGDRVIVKIGGVNENLVVAELNILSTTFFKFDGTSLIVPNIVLTNSSICNIRRSGGIMESHSVQIDYRTPEAKIEALKKGLLDFCKQNPEKYVDYILVNYEKVEDTNKLYLKILMQFKQNFQNFDRYLAYRGLFVKNLNELIRMLNIKFKPPVQKVKVIEKSK